MTTTPPQGTPPDVLGDKVNEWLEQDGKRSDADWKKMVAYLLKDIRTDVKEAVVEMGKIKKTVNQLEDKNILLWFQNHSVWRKVIITVSALTSISVYALLILHYRDVIPVAVMIWDFINKYI